EKIRAAGYCRWEAFTPFPIHGLGKVAGFKNSLVGWFALLFGGGAFVATMVLIWFSNAFDYPLIVGGKPMFSPPMSFVPSYIMMVLGAAVGAFVGMLALNGLPRLHHPLLQKARFALASRDRFFLVIGANDPKFSETETRRLLESLGGTHIELVEA
ncbi:MAG: DUF3341 domain-containing protein, partial [Limisphaerales bacterium]